ncbi:MFS transporter [Dactylosporangium sp. CA-233914]|uniref:MFS transporter n=1 Tax=Dactylosporangium sp. CA-233914 TaxID=3239934 RepID=UPI003D8C268A
MTLLALRPTAAEARTPRRDAAILAAMLTATFLTVISATLTTVAGPALSRDLGVPGTTVQWLTTGYMLAMAAVIPATPVLTRRFRLRPLYLTAMTVFLAGTVLAATAPGFTVLLAGRMTQAAGGAVITPLLLTVVAVLVPPQRRGRTMGLITLVMAGAPALAPVLAGLVVDCLGWRALFWLTLSAAAAALALGLATVRDITTTGPVRFDLRSAFLAAAGLSGIVLGVAGGCGPLATIAALTGGGAALVGFVARQRRLGPLALVNLHPFRVPQFTGAVGMLAVTMVGLAGSLLLLPIDLQHIHGHSAGQTGLLLLPGGLVTGILAPLVGRLYDRHGPAAVLPTGALGLAAALWTLALLGPHTNTGWTIAAHLLLSASIAFLTTPLFTLGLNATAPDQAADAGAVLNTVQQIASAAGGGLLVAIGSGSVQAGFRTAAVLSLAGIVLAACLARSTTGSSVSRGRPTGSRANTSRRPPTL